jgi:hypothetical protein
MRKASKKTLKLKAWKAFARFIKARDARKDGFGVCCTCNAILRWDDPTYQAGHFIGGRGNAVLFQEEGVHGQCARCNKWGSGEQFLYGLFMKRKYNLTDDHLEQMRNDAKKPFKYCDYDYIRIAEEYNNKADALIALKGL